MKTVLFSLILCLFLTACGQKTVEPEIVVPEPQPVVTKAPEPGPIIETPEILLPPAPEPLPVYIYNNKAFDSHGDLLFTCPREQQLSLPRSYNNAPLPPPVLEVRRLEDETYFFDYYAWNGQSVLTGISCIDFLSDPYFCGDLLLSHSEDLLDAEGTTWPVDNAYDWPSGELLYTKAWNCTYLEQGRVFLEFYGGQNSLLLDEDRTVIKEFPPGSSASLLTDEQGLLYLALLGGKRCTLLDTWGEPILDESFQEIYAVTNGCVIVQKQASCLVVDLATGETVFQGTDRITALLPDCLVVSHSGWSGPYEILGYDDTPRSDQPLDDINYVDKDLDGETDLLVGTYFKNGDPFDAWAICFDAQGREL